ncbi:nucleoside 2-deoxyribosyltransferase [Sulfitobacter sp. W027]|uniref:nucleoside 2-deoxyribosyltransferase n=1 Tax=Sulfitobacter sp. W027 TaxID=2867025 RepID=UPI0021A2BC0E|nr:nucleoside 2-deoxyribosyltransferase [Sulfitobacter sp. W027]UWR33749.1 nucleoside 2-deoxyribosyltransferase [Sulfitobacter sp. W027]
MLHLCTLSLSVPQVRQARAVFHHRFIVAQVLILSNSSEVFVAYASTPPEVRRKIEEGCEIASKFNDRPQFKTWAQNDIVGLDLVQPIIEGIEAAPYVVADITSLNVNVVYEIGYAIGLGKRVIIVRNAESDVTSTELNKIGIFDTLGYDTYSTAFEFASKVTADLSNRKLEINYEKNKSQPLYVVGCARPNETSQRITSRIKKSRLVFRSFSPSEEIRLSAPAAIENIASSLGVVLEWRGEDEEFATRHNVRTAFCAGLAHALRIATVIFAPTGVLVPLDFRNSTIQVARPEDIDDGMVDFVPCVAEALQEIRQVSPRKPNKVAEIDLGDPAAENEMRSLNRYFLQSATFSAAMKGDVRTIVGRKGSGKTAIWARIRNSVRSNKKATVVDLKPEGYQLVKLREDVLVHLSTGQGLHVAMAFWEYLLLLEVATKVVENDRKLYSRDQRLTEGYEALSELVAEYSDLGDSDFSERLHKFSVGLAGSLSTDRDFMTGGFKGNELTNKIYAVDIKRFRACLFDYLKNKEDTWVLFDNLDRGWPTHGLEDVDFTILRSLIDAARKLGRSFDRAQLNLNTIVFIRDDIYTELVSRTSDFGKEQPNRIDWQDPDQLREMLRLRLVDNPSLENMNFEDAWASLFCSHYFGEETSEFVIGRSMMRPRNLLNLINHCRSVAINRQHVRIEEDDLTKGLESYSTDLLVELSREMEDVLPAYDTLLWDFVHSKQKLTTSDLYEVLDRSGVRHDERERVVERLIYYGFLGIVVMQEEKYIFDYSYEIRLMLAHIRKTGSQTTFSIHPAFRSSLTLM